MRYSELKFRYFVFLFPILFISLLLLNCGSQPATGRGPQVLEEAAEAMGGLQALASIGNITRQGTRQVSSLGHGRVTSERLYVQPARPYTQIIDFTVPREANGSSPDQISQMENSQMGGYLNVSGRALRVLEPKHMEAYRKEWGRDIAKLLVHALGEKSRIEGITESILEGQRHQVVSLRYIDGVLYQVYVDDSSHLISKLDFVEDRNPYGDLAKERIFSDYREVEKVKLPFSEITKEMDLVTQVREWSEIRINDELQEDLFEIPAQLQAQAQSLAQADAVPIVARELAEGVYFGEGIGMHNMWVEFEDFVLVAEGPNNEGQSLEVIRQIRETCGDKPIRYLVTTHHHEDHTGGIRTYASEGAIIVTHANNEALIREQLTLPHTLNPDRLAQSQREPQMELVTDRKTISDGTRTVELLHFPNPHTNGYLTVYLPRERIIFQSDMFTVLHGETGPPVVRPEAQDFHDAIIRAEWKVDQIVPGHGRLLTWEELVDALETSK